MTEFTISKIFASDRIANQKVTDLLEAAGIKRDANLDYTCGIFEDDGTLIATGSLYRNSLRCFAVCSRYTGEGLLNQIISHLINIQFERGYTHLFVYTKPDSSKFFRDLGFYPIAEIPNLVVFMENRRSGFADYLKGLKKGPVEAKKVAALVMNANPFTLGHQYLVEKAASENDHLHLFMVSEDSSLVPFSVRKDLIKKGTAHLTNITYHETGPYIISNATFPSYFQKDETSVIASQAEVDLSVFVKIAETLGINRRYVGEEPNSLVTGIYNTIMQTKLPENNIECLVIPRKEVAGQVISASTVRQLIKDGQIEAIKDLTPQTTYDYFTSDAAQAIISRIQKEDNVIHY